MTVSDTVEGGGSLAWRLLATLEGGSLLLATTAIVAYTARNRVVQNRKRPVRRVLLTDANTDLGVQLKTKLESGGCTVSTLGGDTLSTNEEKFDALVVVGAEHKVNGLQDLADMISKDVYENMRQVESVSCCLRRGGRLAWTGIGSKTVGSYSGAADAFDELLRASLSQLGRRFDCEVVWVGRGETPENAAEKLVDNLLDEDSHQNHTYVRNFTRKISDFIGRWLKIVS